MHLEARQYNDQLYFFTEMLKKWDADLQQYEQFIDDKAAAGQPTGSLNINLNKGNERYNKSLTAIEAAHVYIKALQKEIDQLKRVKAENKMLKQQVETIERQSRLRICDML